MDKEMTTKIDFKDLGLNTLGRVYVPKDMASSIMRPDDRMKLYTERQACFLVNLPEPKELKILVENSVNSILDEFVRKVNASEPIVDWSPNLGNNGVESVICKYNLISSEDCQNGLNAGKKWMVGLRFAVSWNKEDNENIDSEVVICKISFGDSFSHTFEMIKNKISWLLEGYPLNNGDLCFVTTQIIFINSETKQEIKDFKFTMYSAVTPDIFGITSIKQNDYEIKLNGTQTLFCDGLVCQPCLKELPSIRYNIRNFIEFPHRDNF
jgi:hypothetical protein